VTPAQPDKTRPRIAIISRYNVADQYIVTAEFKGMLNHLAAKADVLFLSMKGQAQTSDIPPGVTLAAIPMSYDRAVPRDILIKGVLLYFLLPISALRLRKFKPNLIFVVDNMHFYGLLLKWLCRTRVGTMYGDWTFHNMFGRKKWSKPFLAMVEAMDRFEMRRLTGFFCRAESAGEHLVSWGIEPNRIRTVRDAPDPVAFSPRDQTELRRRCGFTKEDIVLLYHGVMHQGKGLDKLLQWTSALIKENPKIGIILVGGGPEQDALRALAAELGLGKRALFTGWLKSINDVGDYCNAADICIAMRTADESNDRIVPGALLHSMACRKIVIGPRLRGIGEILTHGINGYMFTADDGEDFKRLIRELIRNRDQWEAVRENAYQEIMDNYSVEAASLRYAQALEHFATLPLN
jgi:glycosyltransferase involved in cell wall biosynthesis